MVRTLLRSLLLLLLLGGIVMGCHKSMVQQKVPPDPLLISKKPIEGKSEQGEPFLATRIDPQPPPLPRREVPPPDPTRTVHATPGNP
jgi:hypothetical protein